MTLTFNLSFDLGDLYLRPDFLIVGTTIMFDLGLLTITFNPILGRVNVKLNAQCEDRRSNSSAIGAPTDR